MNLEIGSSIQHYKIISSIGKGGMGEVFLAQDTKLDRKVALKVLPPEFAEDSDRMYRFVREAKSASALNHPNIITIYEIGEDAGIHFMATEFIDGKTLVEYSKAKPLNLKSVLRIAIQIASALDEAHAAGIVHRDMKPDNVMVKENGLVKILDFGIAKLSAIPVSSDDLSEVVTQMQTQTQAGMIIGTPNYMSPEQAKGKVVDARTDIFSFGVVLYELVAGHHPFAGENSFEMIGAILKDEPTHLDPNTPTEIQKLVSKCLIKDRDQRYQTIKDVLIDLKDAKKDLEFQKKLDLTFPGERAGRGTAIQPRTTVTDRPGKNNFFKWILAAGAILMIIFAGLFIWSRSASRNSLEKFELKAITSNGEIEDSAISPDGKFIALVKNEKGKQSLWIQQRELQTSGVRLTEPSSENSVFGIRFTPGGDKIYFLQRPRNDSVGQLFSVPSLGGQPPQLILSDVDSPPAFSPDAAKFAFMRRNTKEGITALLTANPDGSNLEEIARRKNADGVCIATCRLVAEWKNDSHSRQ